MPTLPLTMSEPLPISELERIARLARAMFDVALAVFVLPAGAPGPHSARPGLPAAEQARLLAACGGAAGGQAPGFAASAALGRGASLRLLDSAPRPFGAAQQALLDDLAALAAPYCARLAVQKPEPPAAPAPVTGWPAPLQSLLPLLDELAEGLILLDGERRVAWANRRAAALAGIDANALPGRRAQDFVVDAIAGLVDAAPPGTVVTREMTGRQPDGGSLTLDVAACALDGEPFARYGVIVRDAAERHEAAWRARASSERRHKTFSLASHELRTPLASIIGFTDLLLKREFDAATARELLEIVHTQAGLMAGLVNGVLDLARIEAGGRQALRVEATPIEAVLTQALADADAQAAPGRIRFDIAPGLAPVAGDRHRLQTAFAQVLGNALRYSDSTSTVEVRAWADPAPGAGALLVRVTDKGAGLSLEDRERLFEPFFRGSAAQAAGTPGSGLGMALVKEIVDVHNGGIEIASAPGGGTSVTVRLPLAADERD